MSDNLSRTRLYKMENLFYINGWKIIEIKYRLLSDIHNKNWIMDKNYQNKDKQKAQVHEKWALYTFPQHLNNINM